MLFSSGMYTFGSGCLSTVSLKNRETALKGCLIKGDIARVCLMISSRMSSFSTPIEPSKDELH